ncbi:hypothetical protein [Seonamhaeicola sp. ML3]|uniref:hypothetical protein n=1 Tax=Seonamhaeicola sp. ML3 TaxID=2937786 RepID=UPI00200E4BF4|nr:hypothetical protein [Seonamhaeicola sp. ML3]
MKFLSPEIEAFYKRRNGTTSKKSLIRQSKSCGIFQDCYDHEKKPLSYHYQTAKKHNLNT